MMPTVVAACTTLHNMCEIHTEKFDEQWLLDITEAQAQHMESLENVFGEKVDKIRSALAEYFASNPLD